MTNREAIAKLDILRKDRQWLSDATGYSINSLYNTFAGDERELKDRMNKAFERAFSEEERRQLNMEKEPPESVWDLVFFSGVEVKRINDAKQAGGYDDLAKFYRDAVIRYADDLLENQSEDESPVVSSERKLVKYPKRKRALRVVDKVAEHPITERTDGK